MSDESLFSLPFDEKLLQAVMSPNEKDWFKYRLGDESPSVGEMLGISATGRFSRARDEREAAMKAILGASIKSAYERGQAPPTIGAMQAQNPMAAQISGVQPDLSQIPQPPMLPGQQGIAPLDAITPLAQQELLKQPPSASQ